MSKLNDLCNRRVDAFVSAINSSPRQVLSREEIPERCRLSEADWPGTLNWQIATNEDANWLPDVERRLPFRLPLTFRSLISRYTFPSFVAGPLTLYSVGLPDLTPGSKEYRYAIFGDRFMSPFLLKQGLLPFARPEDWSYDPMCFDYRNSQRKLEPVVVRIDHEEILCNGRIRVVESLAKGFDVLLEELTRALVGNTATRR